ncbi:hypothetical protein Tco_1146595 [Tanacetum coccineum]
MERRVSDLESNISRANPQAAIVSEEKLVPSANRIKITKNNQRDASELNITDTLLKLVVGILKHHKLYKPVSLTVTGIVHSANLDYASLIWVELEWQAVNKTLRPSKMSKLIYTRFIKLIIDQFLSCNKSIPQRFDVDMHSEGQDSPLTKLINTVDESVSAQMVAAAKLLVLNVVIRNGDSPPPKRTIDGVEQTYPLTTAEEKLARKNELKRNKPDLETLSMDDLYNNLKIYEAEIMGSSSINQNTQNVAFVSSNIASSTNEVVKTAHGVSAANSKNNASTLPNADSLSDVVIYSFFASQSNSS